MDAPRPGKPFGTLVFFPGALGDFLCFLPTLLALRRSYPGRLRLVAEYTWTTLLDHPGIELIPMHRREVADLFSDGSGLREATRNLFGGFARIRSWTGHADPHFLDRLAQLCEDTQVFPFRDFRPAERAPAYFARTAGLTIDLEAQQVLSNLRQAVHLDAVGCDAWLRQQRLVGERLLVLHPGSGARRKNWQGFHPLVEAWRRAVGPAWRIIELAGPAESENSPAPGCTRLEDAPLPLVAALLARADLYVGNDSGISHLAGIIGTPGLVLFGSTDPIAWRPLGHSLSCLHRPLECSRCPNAFCEHRLAVAEVVERLLRMERTANPESSKDERQPSS